jgi:cell wall-associated NlpC family hydrolase
MSIVLRKMMLWNMLLCFSLYGFSLGHAVTNYQQTKKKSKTKFNIQKNIHKKVIQKEVKPKKLKQKPKSKVNLNIKIISKKEKSPISSFKERLIRLAKSKIGSPYVYGRTGPRSFDCSGFVYYLHQRYKRKVARNSGMQSRIGKRLKRHELRRGDIVFFATGRRGRVNHSGIYLGKGKFIHASSGRAKGVTISDLDGWYKRKFLWGIHSLPYVLQNTSHK